MGVEKRDVRIARGNGVILTVEGFQNNKRETKNVLTCANVVVKVKLSNCQRLFITTAGVHFMCNSCTGLICRASEIRYEVSKDACL